MNFSPYFFVFMILFFSTHLNGQISEQVKSEVDQVLTEIDANEAGIIIGIVKDDELIYVEGRGKEVIGRTAQLSPPLILTGVPITPLDAVIVQSTQLLIDPVSPPTTED